MRASPRRCRGRRCRSGACPRCCSTGNSRRPGRASPRSPAAPRSASSSALPASTAASTGGDAVRGRQPHRSRLDRVRARAADRSAPMTVAQFAPAISARLLALAAARLARAQSVLRRRRGGDGDPRAGAADLGPQRVRARRAASPTRCRRPTPTCCAARSRPTASSSTRRRRNIIAARERDPRDAAAGAVRRSRPCARPWPRPARARQAFDQVIQGVFAVAAAQMSPAGRHALADWPPGRNKSAGNRQ